MLREIARKYYCLSGKSEGLRVTNPAMLMRSLFGAIIFYYITKMVISTCCQQDDAQNATDIYVDIFLHGF